MKKIALSLLLVISIISVQSQVYQPYTLALNSDKSMDEIKANIVPALENNNFSILGSYLPANDASRWIIIVSHPELIKAVEKTGGLRGFAAALRIGITIENGKTIVSYTSPEYWGRAYYQESFSKVAVNYSSLEKSFAKAFDTLGSYVGTGFGSKKGLDEKDLEKYHYMMGMPYFDDTEELAEFDSFSEAVNKIESNLKKGVKDLELVYDLKIPDKNIKLYGFKLKGENGEAHFLPIIDISTPKHTAFLPYEMLVVDGNVYMLHGRFRIALSFPDLSMGTFTKIMSTPGDIEDLLEKVTE